MKELSPIIICLIIPFLGTILGSGLVFIMKNRINKKIEKILLGFAAGVMMSASVWSLLIPSIDLAIEQGVIEWIPAIVGFLLGIGFLLLLDTIIPHLHLNSKKPEGIKTKFKNEIMLVLAVTLHNIPEGMAVGVVLAGAINGQVGLSLAGAIALAVGIAIQNFPEGAIISMPLKAEGKSKLKSFGYGVLSGIVEPIAAIITILLTGLVELIPEAQEGEHSNIGTIGVAIGFALMMILDIALG